MKRAFSVGALLIVIIAIGNNPDILDKLYINYNNYIYPSPIIWNNMEISYSGEKTIFSKKDKGPLFLIWKNDPGGFLGFSHIPDGETVQSRIECMKKNKKTYRFISDWPGAIDNVRSHYIHVTKNDSGEKVLFIMLPEKNTLIMFQGSDEGLAYFQPTINDIKFTK